MAITDYYQDYAKYNPIDTSGWQAYDGGYIDSAGNPVVQPDYSKISQAVLTDPNGKINYDLRNPINDSLIGLNDTEISDYYANQKTFADPFYYGGDRNKFSNKQLYDSLLKQANSTSRKNFGNAPWEQIYEKYSPYDPYKDYREGSYEDLSYAIPGFQDLVDKRNKGRDKSFNKGLAASVLAFLGGAFLGPALGAAGEAGGGAAGAAAGSGGAAGAAGGGGFFTGANGLFGNLGSAFANSAVNSAIQGGLTSAISGGNPLTGALTGGVTGGLGSALGGIDFGLGDTGNAALSAALKGGVSSGISGGNPLIGAALAGGGSALGSALNGGFNFGGADGALPSTDGTYSGGGYQLPGGFLNQDGGSSFGTSSPFNLGGNNVGLFDGLFDSGGDGGIDFGQAFQDSIGQNQYDQLLNGTYGSGDAFDFGGLFGQDAYSNSLGSGSFIDQLIPGADSSDPAIQSFLNQLQSDPGSVIDLSNSSGPRIQPDLLQNAPDSVKNLLSQYGPKILNTLLGGGAAGGGGALSGLIGGLSGGGGGGAGGGGNQTPLFYTDAIKDLFSRGRAIADQPFTAYGGQGVAPLDENQQLAAELAKNKTGAFQDNLAFADLLNKKGAISFPEADFSKYINPYIEQAIDPVADRLRESAALERRRNNDQSISRGAFGGTRGAVTDALTERGLEDNLRQLYGTGYSNAFNTGLNQFNADRANFNSAGGQALNIANTGSNLTNADVSRLGTTGTVRRGALQDVNDFGYKEFLRKDDYPAKRFESLRTSIPGTNVSGLTTPPNKLLQGAGALTTAYGLYNSIFG